MQNKMLITRCKRERMGWRRALRMFPLGGGSCCCYRSAAVSVRISRALLGWEGCHRGEGGEGWFDRIRTRGWPFQCSRPDHAVRENRDARQERERCLFALRGTGDERH